MITTIRRLCNTLVLVLLFIHSSSQDLRTFNQNSSRSNNAKALSIFISPVYSSSTSGNKDSLLFRGNGSGLRVGGDYFFGKAGIGFSTGFSSSSVNDASINNFLKDKAVPQDQMLITKAKQQNMYLLLGPSVRFGNKVELYAHAKGGLFINNGGLVSIQQRGAVRAAYRNESTDKNMYPGFLTGMNVQYKTKSDVWSFGIGVDYMNTKSEVNNYDARRGGGVEALKLSGNIQDIVAGISVRYNILSGRDHTSGQSTGRLLPTVNKREIVSAKDAQSGLSTGRLLPTVNKKEIAIDEPGVQKTSQSCGTVTKKITNPDGTTEEMTFACPRDAADYAERTRDITSDPGTIWSSSNERFNKISNADGSRGIVSGRLTWSLPAAVNAIVTNNTVRGGSTTMNSQTSSTRQTQQSSFGSMVRLSAREASTGMATGRRTRDAASGLATGKLYEPIFAEGQSDVCNPCLVTAKMSDAKSNPLYNDKNMSGVNPFYQGNERTIGSEDEDCNGIAGMDVSLIDVQSGSVVAKTKTEQCGDFFFANVPEGNYVVKVTGGFTGKKGYDVYLKSKMDLRGGIMHSDDWMQLTINTSNGNSSRAINNSHSNIKNLIVIEADLDGDGEFESTKVLVDLYDGTTKDITAKSRMNSAAMVKKVTVRGWDPKKKEEIIGNANGINEYTVSIDNDNGVSLTTTHENGTKEEVKVMAKVSRHSNVIQFIIPLDQDNDGTDNAGRVKTKSNIKNDRVAAGDVNGDGLNAGKITKSRSNIQNNRMINEEDDDTDAGNVLVNAKTKIGKSRSNIQNNRMINDEDGAEIWSPRSNIKMLTVATGDVDGDGRADLVAGNKLKNYFENGDIPAASQRKPGDPIPDIDIRLGKNPGGQPLQNAISNADGEFEFTKLEAGDYFITVQQNIIIDDETLVTVAGDETEAENINTSESNLKEVAVKTSASQNSQTLRLQNNNTVRSNRTDNALIDNSGNSNSNNIAIDESGQSKPKEKSNTGPVKWMAPESMKTAINNSHSNIKNLMISLDDLDKQLNADHSNARSIINTSRSNIKSQRAAIYNLEQTIDELQTKDQDAAMDELEQKRNEADLQFLKLRESVKQLGPQYNSISNVLKTKHDTVKNSIGNIR